VTWEQRFGALAEFDGDEWDAAYERLEQEWRAAYTAAFVEIAVSRGWRREDAETWPVGIGDEAFIEAYLYDWDPWRAAAADVSLAKSPPDDQGCWTTADCGFPSSETAAVPSSRRLIGQIARAAIRIARRDGDRITNARAQTAQNQ
jgi:hypothetical protein